MAVLKRKKAAPVALLSVVLPLQRLQVRQFIGSAIANRIDVVDFPAEPNVGGVAVP